MNQRKPIEYARHARLRMLERGYVGQMVEDALFDRDDEYAGNIPGSLVAVKSLSQVTLHVCYLESEAHYLICSVFEDRS